MQVLLRAHVDRGQVDVVGIDDAGMVLFQDTPEHELPDRLQQAQMIGQRKDALENKVANLEKQLDRMVGEQTRDAAVGAFRDLREHLVEQPVERP